MARVLVTGGAGFIGSHLCDRLVARGDDVVVVDNLSSGNLRNLRGCRDQLRVIEADVIDLERHAAKLGHFDTIFHLAALISGYDSLGEPDAYVSTNVNGMLRVIKLAKRCSPCRVVFASSSTVYGNQPRSLHSELTLPSPATVYALTKLTGEHLLAMYAPLNRFEHVSLRLFNVYGPRQSPDHPYANVTCKYAHAAANGAPVRLYGDGKQTRDFVYVDDVVDAFLRVDGGSKQYVYNVGSGSEHSISELLASIQNASGTTLEVEQCPPWPNDIRSIRADISRIHDELGFTPRVDLATGLERTVRYFREASKS